MRKLFNFGFIALMLFIIFGCKSTPEVGKAGKLPDKWWTMNVGDVQNIYRGGSSGEHKAVILFIGFSDDATNESESTAIAMATMDAKRKLSYFLSEKFTGISQQKKYAEANQEIIDDAVKNNKITRDQGEKLTREVNTAMKSYYANITSTQFSTFRELANHTEKKGIIYKGWVCYSMTEEILNQTKEIQKKAFETLMIESEEYKNIMSQIQEVTAQKMLEVLMDEASFKK